MAYDDPDCGHRLWQDVWPTEEDFKSIMPLNWPEHLQELLPGPAEGEYSRQFFM
jgi:hypothetical protein